jgi:RNA-splicing ligase RtcB
VKISDEKQIIMTNVCIVFQEKVGKEWSQRLAMLVKDLHANLQSLSDLSDLWA